MTSHPISAGRLSVDEGRGPPKVPSGRRALNETPTAVNSDMAGSTLKSAPGNADNAELVALVQRLSAQVENLTSMVAGQAKD